MHLKQINNLSCCSVDPDHRNHECQVTKQLEKKTKQLYSRPRQVSQQLAFKTANYGEDGWQLQ